VANAVAQVVQAAEAADDLGEALEAGDEGRAASAVGNLTGGVLGTAGSLVDGVAGTMPEEAQGALNTVANVTRGAAGAARVTEQVVSTFQAVERAVSGRAVRFRTSAEVDRLVAERASGKQRLGELYEFKVLVEHSEEGGLDGESVDALLSHPARVGVNREHGDGEVSGMLRRVEMLSVASSHHGHAHYELTLVPKLWRLRLVTRSRVFMDMTHLEVVLAVLEEHGFDAGRYVLDHTEESYPTHETVVQYRESDFDFVYRLLQHNGIHTRFEQNPRGEALVLGDRNASFVPVPSHEELRYHPQDFAPDDGAPRVFEMRQIREPRVGEVILRDFNWRTPHAPVRAEAPVDEATGYGSLDLYGEHVHDEAEARRLATVRAEEQLVGGHRFVGKTSLRGVAPGTYFDLSGHPHGEMNRRYLVIATDEAMDEGHAYFNTFTAIPFDVTYRPRRTVRWPRVNGAVHAIVDGEARSTATPIDDAGRYRLVLPYDVGGAAGGRASRWVRRAQPSAGAGYGMHLPLHIGTEVAVVHLNGDPDRPLIVGAVPNAATEAPVIAANAPQSVIRTGSGVVFELDDDC
jgi:type VI secretion system secreted protein VgrG